MRRITMILLAVMTASCVASKKDVAKVGKKVTKAVEKTHNSLSDQHVTLSESEEVKAELAKRIDETRADLAEISREAHNEFMKAHATEERLKGLSQVALVAADVATGGRVGPIIESISTRIAESTVAPIASELRETTGTANRVASSLEKTEVKLDEVKRSTSEATANIAVLTTSSERIQSALSKLSDETLSKISTQSSDLESLKASSMDRAEFDTKLEAFLTRAGLSPAEINDFKNSTEGLSMEEILALLLATGTAAATSRMGKSRSKEEIDQLKDRVNRVEGQKPASPS